MIKVKIFIFLLMFNPVKSMSQSSISFISEYIDFKVDSHYFTVNGIYNLANKTNEIRNMNITFPFVSETSKIDSIRVININENEIVQFHNLNSGILFNIRFYPLDTVTINIFYREQVSKRNIYILTSTKYWSTPLEKAVYTLTLEEGCNIVSFSYNPDSVKMRDNKLLYFWNKTNFLPQRDFEVYLK